MSETVYIDPEEKGREDWPEVTWKQRPRVKNLYCPRDGHYCEQPNCDNCMLEQKDE